MQKHSNVSNIALPLAVWLAQDSYDHEDHTISTTQIIKPLKQLILAERVPTEDVVIDISDLIASSIGTAIHDSIDNAWKQDYVKTLKELNYSANIAKAIVINPTEPVTEAQIPIYIEQRHYRKLEGQTISGKSDFIINGLLSDVKTTSCYTFQKNTKTKDYQLQGSIYRWLASDKITEDYMEIHYIFTDWVAFKVKAEQNYPPSKIHTIKIPLLSLEETEAYLKKKYHDYLKFKDANEIDIPRCTTEELWRTEPVYKYYKNPNKTMGRSTKNFKVKHEAYLHLSENNNVGIVMEVLGEVRACRYCSGFSVCSQKDEYIADGSLSL